MRLLPPGISQVIVATIVQAVSAATVFTAYSVIAVPLQAAFEPSRMVLMLGITAVALVSGITSPLLGKAIDRYSLRGLMIVGAVLLSLGLLLLSLSQSMVQVIAVYAVCFSVSVVIMGPMAASSLLVRWFHRRRGLMIGIAGSGTAIGGLIIPPLLQILIDEYSWRAALQIFSVIAFLLTVPVIALLTVNRPSDKGLSVDGQPANTEAHEQQQSYQPVTTGTLLRYPGFWFLAILLSLVFSGATAISSNLMPIVIGVGVDATRGAFLLSILSAAGLLGKLACAGVVDRTAGRLVFAIILSGVAASVSGILFAKSYWTLAMATFAIGFFAGGASPLWSVLLAKIYGPQNFGRVMGLMTPLLMPGTLLAPPLFGYIFDRTGSYDYAFIGYIILLVVGILLFLPHLQEKRFAPIKGG